MLRVLLPSLYRCRNRETQARFLPRGQSQALQAAVYVHWTVQLLPTFALSAAPEELGEVLEVGAEDFGPSHRALASLPPPAWSPPSLLPQLSVSSLFLPSSPVTLLLNLQHISGLS